MTVDKKTIKIFGRPSKVGFIPYWSEECPRKGRSDRCGQGPGVWAAVSVWGSDFGLAASRVMDLSSLDESTVVWSGAVFLVEPTVVLRSLLFK